MRGNTASALCLDCRKVVDSSTLSKTIIQSIYLREKELHTGQMCLLVGFIQKVVVMYKDML